MNIGLIEQISDELRDMLGEDFDAETFWDTLDGETDALDIADSLLRKRAEAKSLEGAIKAEESALKARRDRMSARAAAADKALLTLLDATGEKKIERPLATVSRRSGSLSVRIIDESAIPTQLCKVVKSPDKTAIKKQISGGEDVPGAELVRGSDGVTVRVA